jgi:hypothetical protein
MFSIYHFLARAAVTKFCGSDCSAFAGDPSGRPPTFLLLAVPNNRDTEMRSFRTQPLMPPVQTQKTKPAIPTPRYNHQLKASILQPIDSSLSGWPWNKLWPDPLESAICLTFPAPPYPLALILCFLRLSDFLFSFLISEDICFHNSSFCFREISHPLWSSLNILNKMKAGSYHSFWVCT